LAVLVVKWIYPNSPDLAYLSGMMAIIGHIFPFYLKFRGGKGVATLVGMMFGLNWKRVVKVYMSKPKKILSGFSPRWLSRCYRKR